MRRQAFIYFAVAILALLAGGCAATDAGGTVHEPSLAPTSTPAEEPSFDADDVVREGARAQAKTRPAARPVARSAPVSPPKVAKAAPPRPRPEMWDGKGTCEGLASFYAGKFIGRKTANGERYTGKQLTAAHRVLPFGTHVRVQNLKNGLDVIVRINDRGPYIDGRVIDLSPKAAKRLHMTQDGVVPVRLDVVAAWMAEE
jgi:rare lipoprotein A